MIDINSLSCYFETASVEGISLAPTLLFIIGAYVLYALYKIWSRSQRRRLRGLTRPPANRLLRVGGGLLLCCLLGLAVRSFSPPVDKTCQLSGVLGAPDAVLFRVKARVMPEKPPLAVTDPPGNQPAYALLHPETPPVLLPERPASSANSLRKPKLKRPAAGEVKKPGAKEKPAAAKSRVSKAKLKKTVKPPPRQQAYSAWNR
jgi:hypothetical protein